MPLNQVSTVSVPEARMLSVQVWDKGLVKAVEKAIRTSDLGLNPSVEGNLIRVPIPELSQQRREELAKVAARYAEAARVAVRNVRRDGMEQLKKQEKDGELSQDEQHKAAHAGAGADRRRDQADQRNAGGEGSRDHDHLSGR